MAGSRKWLGHLKLTIMATKKAEEGLFFIGHIKSDYTIQLDGSKLPMFLYDYMDDDIEVYIKKVKVNKTQPQVRYWFGVVIPHIIEFISETEGVRYNRDTIHAFLMTSYGGMVMKDQIIMGRKFQIVERASLAEMSKEEASLLIDNVINDFQLKGLTIPSPGPTGTLSDY